MYHGNPALTLVLFGLPGSFLAIIIYMTCCSDLIDAKDEDFANDDEDDDGDDIDGAYYAFHILEYNLLTSLNFFLFLSFISNYRLS